MNFLTKLLSNKDSSQKPKTSMKLTPVVLAARERIAARKEKEEKALDSQKRHANLTNGGQSNMHSSNHHSVTIKEEVRRLEKRAIYGHNDRLTANSEIMANSKLDLWYNTIAPEDPPDTIAPDMLIPESESESEFEFESDSESSKLVN